MTVRPIDSDSHQLVGLLLLLEDGRGRLILVLDLLARGVAAKSNVSD